MRGLLLLAMLLAAISFPAHGAPTPEPGPASAPEFGAATPSGEVMVITLEEAIRVALAYNRELEAIQGQQVQARARIGQAKASPGPIVDARADYLRQGPIAEFEFNQE